MADKPEELVSVPADLTLVGDDELSQLEATVTLEFDRINEADVTPEGLQYAMQLADDADRIRAELAARVARTEHAEAQHRASMLKTQQTLRARMDRGGSEGGSGGSGGDGGSGSAVDAETIAAAAARGATAALVAALGDRVVGRSLVQVTERAQGSLSAARQFQPPTNAPDKRLTITASVDIPGVARGEGISDLSHLTEIVRRKARSMPVTSKNPNQQLVASIRNEFPHTVDDRTSPGQIDELFRYLTSQDKKDSLVAAGGWCAPSEIRYDFFNIACADGLVDLPTFGVSRGGVQVPVSPSLADVLGSTNQAFGGFSVAFNVNSIPWLWTEASDIAAATGSPTKHCIRVPCPTFTDRRLECYGICVTAGNLTDDAYPESTANFIRLMMAAHAHAMNGQIINTMLGLCSAATDTGGFAAGTNPAYQQIYGGISLGVVDYRARYGMCEDDVLEVVAPFWLKSVIRADLAHRTGIEPDQVSDATINGWFTDLNVRVQWVNDWQVRGASQFGNATPMTAWPTTVDVMIYAAGTFLLGNGLSLDLGVVRDSALNATNDHTAAWTEECHLVTRVGHEARRYNIDFNVVGRTGSANITGANL